MDKRLFVFAVGFLLFFVVYLPTSESVFPSHTIVVQTRDVIVFDEYPYVVFPHDLAYVYLGKNIFNLTIVLFNYHYNITYLEEKLTSEFSRANITFTYHILWLNMSGHVFYMSKLNSIMWNTSQREFPNTDLVLVMTNYYAVANVGEDKIVIGAAYVRIHTAYVFNGLPPEERVYVAMHEIGHLLGLVHTNDKTDIMYPEYVGQTHFGEISIERLQELHSPD